ncbi:lipase family protein [Paracidovorax anthurii]|nr:lipase family protein [Paracidovorax anthurii]
MDRRDSQGEDPGRVTQAGSPLDEHCEQAGWQSPANKPKAGDKMIHPLMPVRTIALFSLCAALFGCASSQPPRLGTLPTGTAAGDMELSPFYRWTGTLPGRPGVMLKTEAMPSQPEITTAASSQRILYTSDDARWKSGLLPVSGSLYLPSGAMPAGGWPVLAWAHGTVGAADACAPSWQLHRPRDAFYINRWLEQGFAVVATDYQGLGGPGPHPYQFWEAEGRSVLDSVRAALAAHPGTLANRVVISGQSQGSGAAVGATRIAPTYAPDIQLIATIATGVAPVFPDASYQPPTEVTTPGGPARFTVLRLIGGSIPDGGPKPDDLMSDKGRRLLDIARTACVDEMRGTEQREGIHGDNAFTVPLAQLETRLLPTRDMSSVRLQTPLFLGTGLADRTIVPRRQYAAAAALCAAGTPLVWKAYDGITHNGIVNAAFNDELAFVRGAMAGSVQNSCQAHVEPGPVQRPTPGIRFND